MIKSLKLNIYNIIIIIATGLNAQTWETYTSNNDVQDLCCVGDYCWVATTGGVVRVNIHDFSFEEFDIDDGLVKNNTTAITIKNNEVWAASYQNGISIYDGNTWQVLEIDDCDLVGQIINCINTNDDNIWVGTRNGVYVHAESTWTHYSESNSPLIDDVVNSIAIDQQGKIWIGTDNGISVYDNGNWETHGKGIGAFELTVDQDNNIWIASADAGIYMYNHLQWFNFDHTNSMLDYGTYRTIYAFQFNEKNIWIGSYYGHIYEISKTFDWTMYDSTNSNLPVNLLDVHGNRMPSPINTIEQDSNGNMWVGSQYGLYHFNGSTWKRVNISQHLQTNFVTALLTDKEGNIWVGSSQHVFQIKDNNWYHHNPFEPNLDSRNVMDMNMHNTGKIWCTNPVKEGEISVFDGETWTNYNKNNSPLNMNWIKCIGVDFDGTIWLGSYAYGLACLDGSDFSQLGDPPYYYNDMDITDIDIDNKGSIWICTNSTGYNYRSKGLVNYNKKENLWSFYDTSNSGIASNFTYSLAFENDTTLWVTTLNGVSQFNGHDWITYNTENSGLIYNWVISCTIDQKGRKWFGTYGHGVSMLDGDTWTSFTKENSILVHDHIYDIAVDQNGKVYFATNGGLSVYSETETLIEKNDIEFPKSTRLISSYPNPFNSSTTIQYTLDKPGQIKLSIYNIHGQKVTTLLNSYETAGEHRLMWDGTTDRGEPAASGIYFIKLTRDKVTSELKRVLLLK